MHLLSHVAWILAVLGMIPIDALAQTKDRANLVPSDSTTQTWILLDSAAVTAYSPLLSPAQIAATRWQADTQLVSGFGSVDPANALNALPGVLMETRGLGGSRRLNVRGSAIRSPFGVRNTMLYVDGFVLTESDGTSPLEWMDPFWHRQMELVSGAAAPSFGGAYGGALLVNGQTASQPIRTQSLVGTTGSDGMQIRVAGEAQLRSSTFRLSRTQNDGYREHEWNEKWQFEAHRRWGNSKVQHHTWLALLDAGWALPGAINSEADPRTSPGLSYNAHVARRRALAGHHVHFVNVPVGSMRSSVDAWALLRWTDKENPYGTSPFYNGYKRELGFGSSLRLRQRFETLAWGKAQAQFDWTLIALHDEGRFQEWDDAVAATSGDLIYDLDLGQSRVHWSPSLSVKWGNGWTLESSAGLSHRKRMAEGIATDLEYQAPYNATQLLPRFGASKALGEELVGFAQWSSGFSDPTNFESLATDNTNSFNPSLRQEQAWLLEAGLRQAHWTLIAYRQTLEDGIVEVVDANGNVTFDNSANNVNMQGLEMTASHRSERHRLSLAACRQWHTWEYGSLPGSPNWMTNLQHSWTPFRTASNVAVSTWIRAVGPTPLDNEGLVEHPAYATIHVQLEGNTGLSGFSWAAGVRNASNAAYSSWHQLNGVFGKYYNPAPPRTWFFALTWQRARG